MNIAIVGAGIVGVTTAYELAADGHVVTVFERHAAAAEEGSFGPAGMIAPAHVMPWTTLAQAGSLRQLLDASTGLRLRRPLALRDLRWLAACWRAARGGAWRTQRLRMQALAAYSRERLHELTGALQLEYDCSPGLLVLLRSERERKRVRAAFPLLQEAGLRFEELDAEAARKLEPALNPGQRLAGAVQLPDDGVANCRQFAQLMRRQAQALGVRFAFGETVLPLEASAPTRLRTRAAAGEPPEPRRFDAVVVCGGVDSGALLRPLGLRLPLEPVYGYAVTAPIQEELNAPRSGVIDERWQVTVTRLGERVRVAGGAEIGGRPAQHDVETLRLLYRVLQDWFPGAARLAGRCLTVQEWKGARAMLPDAAPVLGPSGVPGVWLNAGHGDNGWSFACGSARALADLIAGREPGLDLAGLGVQRLLA